MESNLLALLLRSLLAATCAIVFVLLARRPLRNWLGARAAYSLWLLVPLMMAVGAAPSLRVTRNIVVTSLPSLPLGTLAAPVADAMPVHWDGVLLAAWLAGALAAAVLFVRAHRRYTSSLGALTHADGVFIASTCEQGPALLGFWKPRIVLPADFARRYSGSEQALIVAHERRHATRRDPFANVAIAFMQCVFWFNPLMHLAAARCRFDQELACDADVLEHHPGSLRDYAAAMLKTQVGGALAPATCHWQSSHPLKERIMQLNQRKNNRAGRVLLALLLASGALGTMAARAEAVQKNSYLINFKLTYGGENSTPTVLAAAGDAFSLSGTSNGKTWKGDFVVTEGKDGLVWLKSQYTLNGKKNGVHNGGSQLGQSRHMVVGDGDQKDGTSIVLDVSVNRAPVPAQQ